MCRSELASLSSSPGRFPGRGPHQIRTRRFPPSGSSVKAARGYGPQIRTVIRGRGSQFILKDYPGALHILVVAPFKVRLKRVMQNFQLNQENAKREIDHFDKSSREFIKRYFKAEWEDPVHYDIVVNTERFSFPAAASIVVDATLSRAQP